MDGIFRAALQAVHAAFAGAAVAVTHEAWIGQDGYGKPSYAAPVSRQAVVGEDGRRFNTDGGDVVASRARISFVGAVEPNGAEGRDEPIDSRDRLTLPGGITGPLLDVAGTTDPTTGSPFSLTAWIGWSGSGGRTR